MLLGARCALRTGPFEVPGEDDAGGRDPFVEPLVELVPVNKELKPVFGRL